MPGACLQPAESLERGTDNEDEYMISDQELLVNRFISVPRDMGQLNCGSYVSGIVRVRYGGVGHRLRLRRY